MAAILSSRRCLVIGSVVLSGFLAMACFDHEDLTEPEKPAGEIPGSLEKLDIAVECRANVRDGTIECGDTTESGGGGGPELDIVGGQGKYVNLVSSGVSYAADTLRADVTVQNLMDAPLGTSDGATITGIDVFFLVDPTVPDGGGFGKVTVCNADGESTFTGSRQSLFHYGEIIAQGETSLPRTWKFCLPPTVDVFLFWVAVHAAMPPRLWYVREPEDVHPEWPVFARGYRICPITVEARDPTGALLTSHNAEICLDIGTNPSGGMLDGQLCKMPIDGRATFDDLTIDANGDGYTLVATSSGLFQRESFPFVVSTPGDFDGDGYVGASDLDFLTPPEPNHYGETGACLLWDINKDTAVDVIDLGILLSNFGGVTTDSVSGATPTGAMLHGSVDPKGMPTQAWFELGTDQNLATYDETPRQDAGSGRGFVSFSAPVSGLTTNTMYYFRMVAETDGTRREGNIRNFYPPVDQLSFITQPSPAPAGFGICPTIQVQAGDGAGQPVSSFAGPVVLRLGSNPSDASLSNGGPVDAVGGVASFFGVTVSQPGDGYTLIADGGSRFAESEPFKVSIPGDVDLDDRVDAIDLATLLAHWSETGNCLDYDINRDGVVDVIDLGILLSSWTAPLATTDSVSNLGTTQTTVYGTINPRGQETQYWFQYGTDPNLATFTPTTSRSVEAGSTGVLVSEDISNLASETIHYFRIVAENAGGRQYGEILSNGTIPGDVIYGEINPAGDVDEYTFQGKEGQEVSVLLQTLSGSSFNVLELCLIRDAGTANVELGCVRSDGADTELWNQSTGRIELPATTTYTVRITADPGDMGPYRFQVHLIDRAPEVAPPGVVFGDTVTVEAIEPPGDVDEFSFEGTEGQEISAFLRTMSGTSFNALQLCVIRDAGTANEELGCVSSDGADTELWGQSTGRLKLGATTTYTVRIWATDAESDTDWGDYHYMVHLIDRAPEEAPPDVVFDDTVMVEAIEPPGDVDEFTFEGTAGQEVSAFLRTISGTSFNVLQLCVVATDFDEELGCVSSDGADTDLWDQSTGRLELPRTTTYTVRIWAPDAESDTDWGDYHYMVHLIDRAPEEALGGVVFGDTVRVEAIEPPGDVDEFTFEGTQGQEVSAFLRTMSGISSNVLQLCVIRDDFDEELGCVNSDGADTELWNQSTGRLELPASTTYTVRVWAEDTQFNRQSDTDWGDYHYMVHLIDRAPEVAPPGVVFGDTVRVEAIEPPGDVDEFTFEGTAGQEISAFLRTMSGTSSNDLELCLIRNDLDEVVGDCAHSDGGDTDLWGQSTGRLELPATTTYTVRVWARDTEFSRLSDTNWGDYHYMVHLIDRAPEDVAATFSVNDLVGLEWIAPPGDIDEFTFEGTAGQVVEVFFLALDGGFAERLQLFLLTASEQQLGTVISDGYDTSIENQSTGPVTLPTTGTYTVRVLGVSDKMGLSRYRFQVRG